jgi:hypothetical protein
VILEILNLIDVERLSSRELIWVTVKLVVDVYYSIRLVMLIETVRMLDTEAFVTFQFGEISSLYETKTLRDWIDVLVGRTSSDQVCLYLHQTK